MNKQQNNCYFGTETRPQIGDIVATCRNGQGVITYVGDEGTAFSFLNTQDGKIYTDLTSDSDLIERPKELTEVIFRHYNKEIIALFPAIAADLNVNNCLSYMNLGQHGAASVSLISASTPALISDKRVSDLFIELTRRGYFLKVVSRFNSKHKTERQKQIV